MILQNLSVHNWAIRVLKLGMVTSIVMSLSSCSDDDEDLLGNWVRVGDFNGVKRSGAVAAVLGNYAYVGTGYYDDDDYRLRDMWRFDPNTTTWKQMADMPAEAIARDEAVAFAAAGKVFVGTGYGQYRDANNQKIMEKLKDFWAFDPVANSWTRVADFPASARFGAIAFAIGDYGYVGTGYDNNDYKDFYRYDPSTDTWSEDLGFPGGKRKDAVAFVINDIAYICTGYSNGTVKDLYSYNPAAESPWTRLRNIYDSDEDQSYDDDYDDIVRAGGVAFVMDGKGYVCTAGVNTAGSSVWEYDPATDLWDEKTAFEGTSRMSAVGFSINNIGYVATGKGTSSGYMDDVWRFEPNAEQSDNDND